MRLALLIGMGLWGAHAITASVLAQPVPIKGIYVCTDSSGRNLQSDRPIPQCVDREQRILGPSGVERGRIGPALSDAEKMRRLDKQRMEQQVAQREKEERRRDAMLLQRFPNRAAHDASRTVALEQSKALLEIAQAQMTDLDKTKQALQEELGFYANDASKAPANWHRAMKEVEQAQQEQHKVLLTHDQEAKRIHKMFDDQLLRLQPLWQPAKVSVETSKQGS